MPAAWIGAGAAVLGAVNSSGGSSAGQAAQGVANIAGGALAPGEATQLANMVNPFGQYNQQYASQLNNAAPSILSTQWGATKPVIDYANQSTGQGGITGALNGQGFGQQINNLVADPSSIYNTAQYQSAFGQGQNAVNATLAAQGLNASGNQLAALQSYGQTFGQNAYNTQLSQLSGLYGQALGANQQGFNQLQGAAQTAFQGNQQTFNQYSALSGLSTGSPQAAAGILQQGYAGAGNSIGQGIGQLANGVGGLLNGLGGSGGGYNFSTGGGTTTGGFGDTSGSGALFGTSAGLGGDGYTYSGGNSWGFTG